MPKTLIHSGFRTSNAATPFSISFLDQDETAGEISGLLSVRAPANEDNIDHYELLWSKGWGILNESIVLATIPKM